jgi:hypothetical protein
MDESITKYELSAAFLIAMLRLVYDGPKMFDGPLEVDEATALLATSLAMQIGHLTGQEPVTPATFAERLSSVTKHSEQHRHHESGEPAGWVTVCVSWLYSDRPICFKIYQPGNVLKAQI